MNNPNGMRLLGLTVPMPTPSCDQTQIILTDQSWHAVEIRVVGALSLSRFHFAWLQMEDFFLKWKNHMETAINSVLFILSLWFPCAGKMRQGMCFLWLLWDLYGLMGDEVLEWWALVHTEKYMPGKQGISNPSLCHSTVENNVSWAASLSIISCMPNISQLLGAYGCTGLLLTPVIQHSEKKQTQDGGWMTDAYCPWHPCTHALRGDWQEFAYESGVKWISGMQWHVL